MTSPDTQKKRKNFDNEWETWFLIGQRWQEEGMALYKQWKMMKTGEKEKEKEARFLNNKKQSIEESQVEDKTKKDKQESKTNSMSYEKEKDQMITKDKKEGEQNKEENTNTNTNTLVSTSQEKEKDQIDQMVSKDKKEGEQNKDENINALTQDKNPSLPSQIQKMSYPREFMSIDPADQVCTEGYWRDEETETSSPFPWPISTPTSQEVFDKEAFVAKLYRVEAARETKFSYYRGLSTCRICLQSNGGGEYSRLGKEKKPIKWPSGYAHYVRVHDVVPSAEFYRFILEA